MQLNRYIDHTLLKATASKQEIITLCEEAKWHRFFSVCVNGCYITLAKEQLKFSDVKVCCVVGFPLGATSTKAKVYETIEALKNGADEIDMVLNVGLLKSQCFDAVYQDIKAVKDIMPNNNLKVILETCYLETSEIIKASELAVKAGADYIKTATGFGTRGASTEDIELMQRVAKPNHVKIKASGGIRDTSTALEYIKLGVDRIGTSFGIAIVSGSKSNSEY